MAAFEAIVGAAAAAVEAIGVGIILVGAVLSSVMFARDGLGSSDWAQAYERYRANLGRAILLGLEFLVAADIIATVMAPLELANVGTLALIVLIRTFLSFALEVEIKGRWPWRGEG